MLKKSFKALTAAAIVAVCGSLCFGCTEATPPTSQLSEIESLLRQGRYPDAGVAADELHRSETNRLRPQTDVLDLLVETRWRNGTLADDTLRHAETAVALRRAESHPARLARSLRNLGRVLLLAGRTTDSIRVLEESLQVLRNSSRRMTSAELDAVNDLSTALIEGGRYDTAAHELNRALTSRLAASDADARANALSWELLALAQLRAGQYSNATTPLERALAFHRAHPDHPDAAGAAAVLGDLMWLQGEPAKARDAYQDCISISARFLRNQHPDIARCTRRLANTLARLGDISGAVKLLEHALQMAEKSLGRQHPVFAGYLNDLAEVHRTMMDYRVSRRLYEQALALREGLLGPDHQDLATIVLNLALVSSELGDLVEARRQFDRAISIWTKRLGAEHPFVALAMASLAQTLLQHGLTEDALQLQRRVLTIRESALGTNHVDTAEAMADLASTLLLVGRRAEAVVISARAELIQERAGSPSPALAAALASRARVLATTGDLPSAKQRYGRALQLTQEVFGKDHPRSAQLQIELARVAGYDDPAGAFGQAIAAESATRHFLRTTVRYLPEREALSYASGRVNGLHLILSLIAGPLQKREEAIVRAFDSVIRSRALVLDEMASRPSLLRSQGGREMKSLWTSSLSARQRLANLVVRGAADLSAASYREIVEDATREAERMERALAEKSETFRLERAGGELGFLDVVKSLPRDTALVSFVRFNSTARNLTSDDGDPTYLAFVVTASAPRPTAIRLGAASAIDADIAQWRDLVGRPGVASDSGDADERVLRAVGHRLRQTIWDPVAVHVQNVSRIFVVPDGALHLLNLSALPVGRAGYIIDNEQLIHYLTTERDVVQLQHRGTFGRGLLALGAPAYTTESAKITSQEPRRGMHGNRTACGAIQSLQFTPLPGTLQEVEDVARIWSANGADPGATVVLTGRGATERAFKTRASTFRVLHLATHGFFLGSTCNVGGKTTRAVSGLVSTSEFGSDLVNPLLQGGLAFANANQRLQADIGDDDGVLTAEEISGLNLEGAEWAVLSACDTALGAVTTGEGVLGLRRAFRIAGARTVIMSLWSVDDQATRQWMHSLYKARLGDHLDTAESVRAASLSILQTRRAARLTTHPFYWGAFVAAGDWQ
jgi:CHAT domain-containing protein/tetratricopeptide (TPR) repeat protein